MLSIDDDTLLSDEEIIIVRGMVKHHCVKKAEVVQGVDHRVKDKVDGVLIGREAFQ